MTTRTWRAAAMTCLVALFLSAAACSGGGDSDEPPTIPTVDAVSGQTQAAVNTEEADALATSTRAPGPEEQPTAASGTVVLVTTGDLARTGLLDDLTPLFEQETGYTVEVKVIEESSFDQTSFDDADVSLIRSLSGIDDEAVVMHTDFVLVGPDTDPALVRDQERADDALRAIYEGRHPFVATIDGTVSNALGLRLWLYQGIVPQGDWYTSSGGDMEDTLALASEQQAYAMSDRWTFLAKREALQLEILLAGDPAQIDAYEVTAMDPEERPDVNVEGARAFAAFITRPDIQQIIGEYGIVELGEPIFVPDAQTAAPSQ